MDVSKVVSVLGVLFGILVAAAAAVAMARASFAKAQIEALRGDRDDLLKRVDLLEADNVRISEAHKQAEEKVRVLEKVVTGREQLEHLQSAFDLFVTDNGLWQEEQRELALDILQLAGGERRRENRTGRPGGSDGS